MKSTNKERSLYLIEHEIRDLTNVLSGGDKISPTRYVCNRLLKEAMQLITRIKEKDLRIEELTRHIKEKDLRIEELELWTNQDSEEDL